MTTRRTFIGAAATLAVADASRPAASAAGPSPYDFAAIDARLQRPVRHRQVFAVAKTSDGAVTGYMRHALDAYEIAMAEGPGTLHVAAVFYGRGVVMGLNDAIWTKYTIADALRKRGDALSSAQISGNPFAADMRVLARRGATFLVCDNALADWATFFTVALGTSDRSPDDVRAELRTSLFPGALLVPAGVAALNSAQEAHFTYVQATL
ncbi:MAG: DsrE family protein [Candidatus Eremiobacteraeota bacterium]|nr:DsrE family protein [Candidatus Eremiobacteraeota bacterium]